MTNTEIPIDDWFNCYGQSWDPVAVAEVKRHPAKFSRRLVKRIYDYAIAHGLIKAGDLVVDPFVGVGLGAWPALRYGIRHIGIEIEQYFYDIAAGCNCDGITPDLWLRFAGRPAGLGKLPDRHVCPQCIDLLRDMTPINAGEMLIDQDRRRRRETIDAIRKGRKLARPKWPVDPALPGTSTRKAQQAVFDHIAHYRQLAYNRNSYKIPSRGPHYYAGNHDLWRYRFGLDGAHVILGDSRNLGALLAEHAAQPSALISSPPFGVADRRDRHRAQAGEISGALSRAYTQNRQGLTAGNLASLDVRTGRPDALISSPPFGQSVGSGDPKRKGGLFKDPKRANDANLTAEYGTTAGNIGSLPDGDNGAGAGFWSAAQDIVGECFDVLAPGAPAFWHVKNFVRKGKIIPFFEDWIAICESAGFVTDRIFHAHMVDVYAEQLDMFGDAEIISKEHLSFFRRHQNRRNPNAAIDREIVILMHKPEGAGHGH